MSLNKLTDVEIGKSLGLRIGALAMECKDMTCTTIDFPVGGCIDAHDVIVRSELKVEGTTDIAGNDFATPDLGQPNFSLHTDGAGATFWSPDATGSGDITYNGVPPSISGQLVKFSSVDGSTANQSNIVDNGTALLLDGQNLEDVGVLEMNKSAPVGASTVGTLRLYANTDNELHQVDEAGVDTIVGGDSFDQPLNTTNDVEFKSVETSVVKATGTLNFSSTTGQFTMGDPSGGNNAGLIIQVDNAGIPDFGFNAGGAPVMRLCSTTSVDGFLKNNGSAILTWGAGTHNFNTDVSIDKSLTIGSETPATEYKLPTTRGTLDQVLKTDAVGVVSWADDTDSFNQDLNTGDDVDFNTVRTAGKLTVGTATPATEWQLTDIRGTSNQILKTTGSQSYWSDSPFDQTLNTSNNATFNSVVSMGKMTLGSAVPATSWQLVDVRGTNGQVLKTTGSQSYWADSVSEDVRYITSPLYGQTDITGLLTVSPLPAGAVEVSNSASYTITQLMASLETHGFTFTLLELTEITDIAVDITLLVGGGTRPFNIYRDSDQAIMGSYVIDTADPVVSGRYKRAITPLLLPADNYRVGVFLNAGDNRGTTSFVGTINPKLGAVYGCKSTGIHGFPSLTQTLNRPEAGAIYFRQPAGVDAQISAQKIATADIDNPGGVLALGADSNSVELGKAGAQTTVRSQLSVLQTANLSGGVSIGSGIGNEYTLPTTRGEYCDILKTDGVGGVAWTRHGNYSKTDTTVVSNTLVKTSIVGAGVGSLVIPAWNLGDTYHVKMAGVVDSEGKTEDVKIRLELGGVIIWESDFIDLDELKNDVDWEVESDFVIKSLGVAGDVYANGQFVYSKDNNSTGWRGLNSQYEANIDTTVGHTLDINAQWTNAKVGNIFTCKMIVLTKLY